MTTVTDGKLFWTLGKSPLFEIRHMDDEAKNKYLKFTPMPEKNHLDFEVATNEHESREIESDEEEDFSDSMKSNTNRVSKRSSPVYVYTYKVITQNLKSVKSHI